MAKNEIRTASNSLNLLFVKFKREAIILLTKDGTDNEGKLGKAEENRDKRVDLNKLFKNKKTGEERIETEGEK